MMDKKKAILFSTLAACLVGLVTSVVLWLTGTYWLTPWWAVALQVMVMVLILALVGWGVYAYLRRPKVDETLKQHDEWRKRVLKNRFALIWKKHSKVTSNPYHVPWYVHVSADVNSDVRWLQQMGFESVESIEPVPDDLIAVRFWVSDSAVLVSVDMSFPLATRQASLDVVCELLMKKRDRQAFNGVLCTVDLDHLLQKNEMAASEFSQQYRTLLSDLNQRTGLSLPTYCVMTNMAAVRDFCELFSTLDEAAREQPFGVLRPVDEGKGYDKAWFDESFDDLTRRLAVTASESLKQQLHADYRAASVAGIFQLSALRYDIEDFLSLTFSQHAFDEVALHFRGFFFVNVGGEGASTDILTYMHASDLGFESLAGTQQHASSPSLFGKNLFRSCIVKEAPLVGVYRQREWRYRASRVAVFGGLLLLFGGFLWMLKASFDYQQALDNQALIKLNQYKENLRQDTMVADDLSSPVFSLSELRDINNLYDKQHRPWYVSDWLPDSSIRRFVHQTYYEELSSVLLTLMRDYILKDLFVYNSLDDKVKMLELLNYHQILYSKHRDDVDSLVNYYLTSLKEEGEGDVALLERFTALAEDLLRSGATPPDAEPELLALVRKSLSANDISELLYQHILQHPDFSRRVDMRTKLNPSYQNVFVFKPGFTGYLIPYLFTREGFEDLYNETGFQLASEAIKSYEGVMGNISGDAEMNRINRQLRERYIGDYVRYWQALMANVSWVDVSGWGEVSKQIEMTVDPVYSPLSQFYHLVAVHTNLSQKKEGEPAPKESREAKDQQTEAGEPNVTAISNTSERVRASIAAPFKAMHQLVAVNDAGQSRLSIALSQLQQTGDWIAKSKETQDRGSYFLAQLQNTDSNNPLAQLNALAADYNDPVLPMLMRGVARTTNRLAQSAMKAVINHDWSVLYGGYVRHFAGRYPFDKQAEFDASLADFADFFQSGGQFDEFAQKYAAYLDLTHGRQTQLKGFIVNQTLPLSDAYQPFSDAVKRMQSGLFIDGRVGVEFLLRAEKMSPDLTGFTLESGSKLFEYRNGPLLWQALSWPIPANQTQDIAIITKDDKGAETREKLSGEWSWFRVADKMQSAVVVGSDDVAWRYQSANNEVSLQIKSKSAAQPFAPRFFDGLTIPIEL
ncbi:type VI secretion protein VasK [Vibrio furnissii]|uniref:Type VI secretion protein VasK n=1 Tax=Vibrio furnissii TaxID=29494 RepID=A0A0Q2MHK0_VIBFU|nr:type VI secretion system membrane subunit TssM [Vibrio furnissii]KQH87178.1 type VI secretion protein VasK [Vibrio furnissii]